MGEFAYELLPANLPTRVITSLGSQMPASNVSFNELKGQHEPKQTAAELLLQQTRVCCHFVVVQLEMRFSKLELSTT